MLIRHISFTGQWAGKTFCGDTGRAEHADMNKVRYAAHLPYLSKEDSEKWVEKHIQCTECKRLYHEAGDD